MPAHRVGREQGRALGAIGVPVRHAAGNVGQEAAGARGWHRAGGQFGEDAVGQGRADGPMTGPRHGVRGADRNRRQRDDTGADDGQRDHGFEQGEPALRDGWPWLAVRPSSASSCHVTTTSKRRAGRAAAGIVGKSPEGGATSAAAAQNAPRAGSSGVWISPAPLPGATTQGRSGHRCPTLPALPRRTENGPSQGWRRRPSARR
jgi:hypothetical protein